MKTPTLKKLILLVCFAVFVCHPIFGQMKPTLAPGAPGLDAQWASAGKQAVGTSNTLESKVWFTLEGGALTEVFYPTADTPNVRLLQFIVVNKKTGSIETESEDTKQTIEVLTSNSISPPSPRLSNSGTVKENNINSFFAPFSQSRPPTSLTFMQTNWAKDDKWRIRKTYTVDPQRDSVLIDFEFSENLIKREKDEVYEVYLYYDASLNNSGMHDTAWSRDGVLLASDTDKSSAVTAEFGFAESTSGFFGTSDGLTQLKQKGELNVFDRAENGNVAQVAKLNLRGGEFVEAVKTHARTTIVLGFGRTPAEASQTADASLQKGFQKCQAEYDKGWRDYTRTLPRVEPKYQAQFDMAAMVLKAHEDKTFRGASVAALANPWGGGNNSNETTSGYHLVWSRDLYQAATAFMALGDKAAAIRALEYLFKYQQKPDGSFPQITWLDGRSVGDSIQMDEVSYPLILAYQLGKTDRETYEKNIKKSADYIVKTGPKTQQERWEEKAGYSPSTIAAEIAGLVCAAEIARANGDKISAETYLKTADDWAQNVERWTATTTGKYGDGNYYLRLTKNGTPDAGDKIQLDAAFDEREIVDAGFLELVRLGIKSPSDPLIVKSLKIIDEQIKIDTPRGAAWYRYNHDGYGETDDGKRWNWNGNYQGKGHLWALLSGERGQYELARYDSFKFRDSTGLSVRQRNIRYKNDMFERQRWRSSAVKRLDAMLGFAGDGLMIPEQIWDKADAPRADLRFMPPLEFGEGTGSATPLAWSTAQFIRLAINLRAGRNLDTPDAAAKRFGN